MGIDPLLSPAPDDAFSTAEIAAIAGFLGADGSVFAMSESKDISFGSATNAIVNERLSALGVGLSLNDAGLDIGARIATGCTIELNPFTFSIAALHCGATSRVIRGTPLLISIDTVGPVGQIRESDPFAAFVLEPSSFSLLALGLAALVRRCRRHHSM